MTPIRKGPQVSTDYVPSREDRFSFGIWTGGLAGSRRCSGGAVAAAHGPARARRVQSWPKLGRPYGVNFHDNDVFAFDATPGRAGRAHRRLPQGSGRDWPGGDHRHHELVRATRCSGTGAFTAQRPPDQAVSRLAKVMRNLGPGGRPSAAKDLHLLGAGGGGLGVGAPPRTSGPRSTGTPRA